MEWGRDNSGSPKSNALSGRPHAGSPLSCDFWEQLENGPGPHTHLGGGTGTLREAVC